MENDYRPIEVPCLVKDPRDEKKKIIEPYTINRANINYHRRWADPDGLKTVIYFRNTEKGLVVECGYDHLNHLISKSHMVDEMRLETLTYEQLKQVKKFVESITADIRSLHHTA